MYSPFRHIGSVVWKKRPIHLTFFVTRRCNAKCPFCFYLKSVETPGEQKELSLQEIRTISRSLGKLLWVAFSGGEIFLRNDLVEISSVFYQNNAPSIMLFPTNGLLPERIADSTKKILETCKRSVIALKLSVDDIGSAHDAIRNTPESFNKTMETYRALAGLSNKYPHFELGINTVFCSENQNNMDAIIDFVAGLKGIRTHTISLVRGNLLNGTYRNVDEDKYLRTIERLEKNLKDKNSPVYRFRGARIKAAQDILQRRFIDRTIKERKRLIPCYAGKLNIVLRENGDVYPCEILTESFGNVRDFGYDIERVMKSERARTIATSIRNNKCYCTHECYFMTNIFFNPRLYPALAKEYIDCFR